MGERTEPGTKDCLSVAVTTGLIGLKYKLARGRFYCPWYYVFFNCSRIQFEVLIVNMCFSAKFQLDIFCSILERS